LRIEASFFGELELVKLLSRTSSLTTLELVDVEDASSSLIRVCYYPFANNVCLVLIRSLSTESFCSHRDHYVDLPQAGDAKPRGVHDPGLGLTEDLCRVTFASSCSRVSASGRATNADAS